MFHKLLLAIAHWHPSPGQEALTPSEAGPAPGSSGGARGSRARGGPAAAGPAEALSETSHCLAQILPARLQALP